MEDPVNPAEEVPLQGGVLVAALHKQVPGGDPGNPAGVPTPPGRVLLADLVEAGRGAPAGEADPLGRVMVADLREPGPGAGSEGGNVSAPRTAHRGAATAAVVPAMTATGA